MPKNYETYLKVAETFRKKGNNAWSQAKRGEGNYNYGIARGFYKTMKLAIEKAEILKKGREK